MNQALATLLEANSIDNTAVYIASATEIIKALLVFAGVVVTAGLGVGIPVRRKAKRARDASRRQQQEIHHSVVNTHPTILRDDVDEIKNLVEKVVRRLDRHSRDIGAIKVIAESAVRAAEAATVAAERAERAAAAATKAVAANEQRLTDHIDGR